MSESNDLNFDTIKLQEVPVVIAGREYVLREADAEAGAFYEDAIIGSMIMQDGKPVSIGNFRQRDLGLLARCLYVKGAGGDQDKRVTIGFVNQLPRKIVEALVDHLKEMSGINDGGETEDEHPTDATAAS